MSRCLLILALMCAAGPAFAQSRPATAALTVERALTMTGVQPMTFDAGHREVDAIASSSVSEAIIEVTGDPGRVYRVRLPETVAADDAGTTIGSFTLRSDNSGDISESLTARMDANGFDRLHVGGRLIRAPGLIITEVSAAVPLSIDYE